MSWEIGRQGTGYLKKKLFEFYFCDCYLIKYREGDSIPEHLDKVPGYRHFRFNIVLKGSLTAFKCPRAFLTGRFNFFRPDLHPHSVEPSGERLVLSLGWIM